MPCLSFPISPTELNCAPGWVVRTKRQRSDRAVLAGAPGSWMWSSCGLEMESQRLSGHEDRFSVRAGHNLVSTLHGPEKETAARNTPPCGASAATTPVLRPTHPPQKRELLYPQVSWAYSWLPPCLHLTGCLLSWADTLPLYLTLASSQLWLGIHSKATLITHQRVASAASGAQTSPLRGAPSPVLQEHALPPPLGWLLWFLGGLSFLFLSLLSLLCSVYSCGGTVFEDFLGEHAICLQ